MVRPIRYWAGAALAAAAAAAALFVVYVPREPGGEDRSVESADLSELEVRCEPGEVASCPVSGKLAFSIAGERVSGFLSAYAEAVGHEGERVFYYSKEDGSVELPAESAERAVGLPKAGRYRVHAVIADRPLAREELLEGTKARAGGANVRARTHVEIDVTE